jgi:hypothetical protein
MSEPLQSSTPTDLFLSGAYKRILRITILLSVAAAVAITVVLGWRSGLGFMMGAPLAYLNLVWLHRGSEMMVERMVGASANAPSKHRLMLAFAGRYALMLIFAYVILKSFPGMRIGFMVGLFVPIAAAICEGIYEGFAGRRTRNSVN